jgi:hypothetical protein
VAARKSEENPIKMGVVAGVADQKGGEGDFQLEEDLPSTEIEVVTASATKPEATKQERSGSTKKSWADGLSCPGCRGTWHSGTALSSHLLECPPFDFAAMKLTELRLTNGQTVKPELQERYRRFLQLNLGPLAGRRDA